MMTFDTIRFCHQQPSTLKRAVSVKFQANTWLSVWSVKKRALALRTAGYLKYRTVEGWCHPSKQKQRSLACSQCPPPAHPSLPPSLPTPTPEPIFRFLILNQVRKKKLFFNFRAELHPIISSAAGPEASKNGRLLRYEKQHLKSVLSKVWTHFFTELTEKMCPMRPSRRLSSWLAPAALCFLFPLFTSTKLWRDWHHGRSSGRKGKERWFLSFYFCLFCHEGIPDTGGRACVWAGRGRSFTAALFKHLQSNYHSFLSYSFN